MFKRNNSLQCKSKAHLSHIYMARGLSPLSVCSVRESNPRDRIQPQRYFALSRARSKSLRNYILIRLIALYNVGNYAKLNPNKTCGHFCIVRWLSNSDLLTAPTDSAITVHTMCNIAVTLSILIVCGSERKFIKIEVELCENALSFFFQSSPGPSVVE